MSTQAGGLALCLVFLAGAGCNEILSDEPEPKVIRKTDIRTIRIPDTHVIRDTREVKVQVPLPTVCTDAYVQLKVVRGFDATVDDSVQPVLDLVTEGHRVMVNGTASELVKITEQLMAARQTAVNASEEKAKALLRLDSLVSECESQLTEK